MKLLILGIIIWSGVHFFKRVCPNARSKVINKIGDGVYRGVVSVLIIFSIVLMVRGWHTMVPTIVYSPPQGLAHVAMLVIAVGFLFLGAAHGKNYISSRVRHPMLTGFAMWAIGHLMSNGDSRSVLLFGSMLIWALIEIYLINKGDGPWTKPEPQPMSTLVRPALITLVIVAVIVVFLHPYLSGVALAR